MENYNLVVTDKTNEQVPINQCINSASKIDLMDFIPPHFTPDLDSPENIMHYEKEIEENAGAFLYPEGLILIINDIKTFKYLQKIDNKIKESGEKYIGTCLERFSVNYMDVTGAFTKKNVRISELIQEPYRMIARLNFII